jgi:hypothetical protein
VSLETIPTLRNDRRMCAYDDSNRYLQEMAAHFEEIKQHGFNSVLLCITEADLAQRSAMHPNKSHIKRMFDLANDHGLYPGIDPWKLGNIFGGEAVSGLGTQSLHSDGRIRHIGIADPHQQETVDLMTLFLDTAAHAGAQYVMFDEPRLGHESENAELEFLDRWTAYAHSLDLPTSVCLTSGRQLGRLAAQVAALPGVDELATDPIYSGPKVLSLAPGSNNDSIEDYIGGVSKTVRDIAKKHGKQSAVWIQGHIIGEGHEQAIVHDGVAEASRYVHNIGFWAFRGCVTYSNIASFNPELVWATAGKAFTSLPDSPLSI